jgi:hypothetical protein
MVRKRRRDKHMRLNEKIKLRLNKKKDGTAVFSLFWHM